MEGWRLSSLRREMAIFYLDPTNHPDLVCVDAGDRALQKRKFRVTCWPKLPRAQELDYTVAGTKNWKGMEMSTDTRWRLFELRRSYLLTTEGRRMSHCVGTYINKCRTRGSSIWSLRTIRDHDETIEATIEIHPGSRSIVQVQGFANTAPSEEAWSWIRHWARNNKILLRG